MKIKRILLTAGVASAMLLAGCGNGGGSGKTYSEEYDATIWVSEVDGMDTLTQNQIKKFQDLYDIKINATIEKQSESNAATKMIQSVANGADIFCFAQDQMMRLVKAGALSQIVGQAAQAIKDGNDADSVAAVTTSDGKVYAYPMTSDNGYFLYYDKSIVQESSVGDFFKILKDCEDNDKTFSMENDTSGWYFASWFFGTGCVSEWTTNEDGDFTAVNDTFKSAEGLAAAKAYYRFSQSKAYLSSSDGGDFSKGSGALISGTWAYPTVKATLGTNMGVAELPSFEQDGETYHMGSFKGCKLMGVKPQANAKKAVALNKLATYLTSKDCQLERFAAVGWGPSNKEALQNETVKADPVLNAVFAQSKHATVQGQIHGSWWGLATTLATSIKKSDGSDEAINAALQTYDDSEQSLFSLDKNAWLLVGAWNDWDNADSSMLAEKLDDTNYGIEVTVGADLGYKGGLFVHPGEWGTNAGGTIVDADSQQYLDMAQSTSGDNNLVFLAGGTYAITLTVDASNNPVSIHIELGQ